MADESAFAQGQGGDRRPARMRNVSVVGHLSFGEAELNLTNTDVWAHGKFAYIGTFSSPTCAGDLGLGVKIIDISDSANPQWIGTLASPPGTRANDFKVARISTKNLSGTCWSTPTSPARLVGMGASACTT